MTPNDLEPAAPDDLTHAFAIVVPIPVDLWYGDPTAQAAYLDSVADQLNAYARATLGDELPYSVASTRYQIGPTAEWSYTQLFTLYADVRPWLDGPVTLLTIGDFARRIGGWLRQRPAGRPVLAMPVVTGLCLAHAQRRHPGAEVSAQTSVREQGPYHTAAHPGGEERYVVWVRVGRRVRYCYVVDGRGEAIEHFKLVNGELDLLVLPDLFDD